MDLSRSCSTAEPRLQNEACCRWPQSRLLGFTTTFHRHWRNGRGRRPFFVEETVHPREKQWRESKHSSGSGSSTEAITPTVEGSVPGVEVLAVELLSPSRFCVYVDHPKGVDHALCERVTRVLEPYRESTTRSTCRRPAPSGRSGSRAHFEAVVGRARPAPHRSRSRAARPAFAASSSPAGHEPASRRADEHDYEIPYETIVRGNLIDEGTVES